MVSFKLFKNKKTKYCIVNNELEARLKVIKTIKSCNNDLQLESVYKMIGFYYIHYPNRSILDYMNKLIDRQQMLWQLHKKN